MHQRSRDETAKMTYNNNITLFSLKSNEVTCFKQMTQDFNILLLKVNFPNTAILRCIIPLLSLAPFPGGFVLY